MKTQPKIQTILLALCARALAAFAKPITALHFTFVVNNADVVQMLLEKGADVNAKDTEGWTPLHGAAKANALETAALLIAKGANVNAKSHAGATPLKVAVGVNFLHGGRARGMVAFLLANGADVSEITLLQAVSMNAHEAVKLLLMKGADVNAKLDGDGNTPLHIAATINAPDTAKLLLAMGANVNAKLDNASKMTPLHLAAGGNAIEIVRMLLEAGADVNAVAGKGWTAWDIAGGRAGTTEQRATMRALLEHWGGTNSPKLSRDAVEMVELFRLNAEQGHTPSQHLLGVAYRDGDGVPQDVSEAVKWLRRAAKQGNWAAARLLRLANERMQGE